MKTLILLRGLPGSGKSTLAKTLAKKDYCHKEADMFFVDGNGNYKFQPSKIKDAHEWCQSEVDFLMSLDHSPVVVSNTFTQEWEMETYYKLAKMYGYQVHSLIVENRHAGVNEHGVPTETLNKMETKLISSIKLR
jgi:predicted kinase